jgi:hypothetical protein
MTNQDLLKTVNLLGIEENTWIFSKDITSVNLLSDGAQNYDYFSQRLYFNTDDGLLKIKYYDFKIITSEFFSWIKTGDSSFQIKPDMFGYYGKKYGEFDKFRNPVKGDIVYTVSKLNGNFVEATKIDYIDSKSMTLESDITANDGVYLCYASGSLLTLDNEGDIFPTSEGMFLEVLENSRNILIRKPKTPYDSDIYISFDGITGISLKRRIVPSL